MLTHFIENRFSSKYNTTVGVEFVSKTITINDKIIKLQIWDTVFKTFWVLKEKIEFFQSGQENFKSLTRAYYRSIAGVILVYDITKLFLYYMFEILSISFSKNSFLNVLNWYEEAKNNGNEEMTCILIGNKNDMDLEYFICYSFVYKL